MWSFDIMIDLGGGTRVRNLRITKRITGIFLSWEIVLGLRGW